MSEAPSKRQQSGIISVGLYRLTSQMSSERGELPISERRAGDDKIIT